jgi:cytosine/adenosine deaminase-related metal-dependent hydrolase
VADDRAKPAAVACVVAISAPIAKTQATTVAFRRSLRGFSTTVCVDGIPNFAFAGITFAMGVTRIFAAWVAPMTGPPVRDAAVVLDAGTIVGVASAAAIRRAFPSGDDVDLGSAVILPGLVNAHTHLELSHLTPGPTPAGFVDWLLDLMRRAPAGGASPGDAVKIGIAQCLRFGVTSVGDISAMPAVTRPVLAASPLAGVACGEVRAMAKRRGFLGERLAAAAVPISGGRVVAGISPHAPYSIETDGYRSCLEAAIARDLPLTTHLAESKDEAEFLADQTGPFRQLWAALDAWDDAVPRSIGGPVRLARDLGLLDYPKTSLAHLNYCDDDELQLLARGRASVVYCPRTHDYFGHPPHRWREMLSRGINVAVGTDSCASSADLNLVDDLRLLHRIAPEMSVASLWEMATVRAARAIGSDAGTIGIGRAADLVAFEAAGDDPLRDVLESDRLPVGVWAGGVRIH